MSSTQGKLLLYNIPNDQNLDKVVTFLSRYTPKDQQKKLASLIRKPPVILSRNISEEAAEKLIKSLKKLGAKAKFLPESPSLNHSQARTYNDHETMIENHPSLPVKGKDSLGTIRQKTDHAYFGIKRNLINAILEVNKELWLVFSIVLIMGIMNYFVDSQRFILSLYTLPTILSAYLYGRRHAVMTALASIVLVILFLYYTPVIFNEKPLLNLGDNWWLEIMAWGSILIITAYTMGTLYERHAAKMKELYKTYRGILVILRHFISKDEYTENHCYRVSIYAAKIAAYLHLSDERIEDLRAAALLHDIGKLKVSREILYKAAKLSQEEFNEIKHHVKNSAEILEPIQGPLGRILPIILAHHERYDGSGYMGMKHEEVPIESRILAVADVYDALVSDRPYRKGMSPFEAKEIIQKGSGKDFDPTVVKAFLKAFERGEMEVPNLVV